MKIVNKKEFMELPTPIVFSHYRPCVIEGLFVNVDNTSHAKNNDFIQASLLDDVLPIGAEPENWSSNDVIDLLIKAEKEGIPFKVDLEGYTREGLYDDKQLYVIYEQEDIDSLVDRLNSIKEEAKTKNEIDTKPINFTELKNIFFAHEAYYGYSMKNIISDDIDIDEDHWYTVYLNFVAYEKQSFVTIIINNNCDENKTYFFTWYDSGSFEEAKKDGNDLTHDEYNELLDYLKKAGFKSDSKEYENMKKKDGSMELIYLK